MSTTQSIIGDGAAKTPDELLDDPTLVDPDAPKNSDGWFTDLLSDEMQKQLVAHILNENEALAVAEQPVARRARRPDEEQQGDRLDDLAEGRADVEDVEDHGSAVAREPSLLCDGRGVKG